jgi:hypothetical protein
MPGSERKQRREVGTRDLAPERDAERMEEPVGVEPDEFIAATAPGDDRPPPTGPAEDARHQPTER